MKADEPRQNRIPFMMSDAELEAVDNWRFANKIGTRAEAIRRLCQMGLLIDKQALPLTEAAVEMYGKYADEALKLAASLSGNEEPERQESYVVENFNHQMQTIERMALLLQTLNMVIKPIHALNQVKDFDEAQLAFVAAQTGSMAELLEEKVRAFEFRKKHGPIKIKIGKGEKE